VRFIFGFYDGKGCDGGWSESERERRKEGGRGVKRALALVAL
jgi:hypothetical protein